MKSIVFGADRLQNGRARMLILSPLSRTAVAGRLSDCPTRPTQLDE
jgi:hypothetical protein